MRLNDLNKIIAEYIKHFGKDEIAKYFNQLLERGKKDATNKKKS
jgi:hypothetical protein|tara:strand:- start:1145 stop:1276 length:132 start_codon:yes stop_codon:yes gene_type:complete